MSVTVTDTDRGWSDLKAIFGAKESVFVDVGTDVPYAVWVEYGTSRMDPRPFCRFTLDEHDHYKAELRQAAIELLFSRRNPLGAAMTALRKLGTKVAKDMQDMIAALGAIDTGRLYRSPRILRIGMGDDMQRAAEAALGLAA